MPLIDTRTEDAEYLRRLIGRIPLHYFEIQRALGWSTSRIESALNALADDGIAIQDQRGKWGLL